MRHECRTGGLMVHESRTAPPAPEALMRHESRATGLMAHEYRVGRRARTGLRTVAGGVATLLA